MGEKTDRELLRAYVAADAADRAAQATDHAAADDARAHAFAEIVRRHADWVYSAAVRLVRDRQRAEDVAQATFLVLARKAPALPRDVVLAAWLFGVVRLTALQSNRSEARRARHEQAAAMQRSDELKRRASHDRADDTADAAWRELEPTLDAMVAKLRTADRQAVTLRYYGRRSMGEVARELGVSDEAARKRVARAIERLRGMYRRAGVVMSAGALDAAVVAQLVHPAPATLSATILSGVAGGAATAAAGAGAAGTTGTASVMGAASATGTAGMTGTASAAGAAGAAGAPGVASTATALQSAVINVMFWGKVKVAAACAAATVLAIGGAAAVATRPADPATASTRTVTATAPATTPAPAPDTAVPANDQDVAVVMERVTASAGNIRNLRVRDFEATWEQLDPGPGAGGAAQWKPAGRSASGSAWYDGRSDRTRVHFTRLAMPWINAGRTGTAEWSTDLSNDIVRGLEIRVASFARGGGAGGAGGAGGGGGGGGGGRATPDNSALVTRDPPALLDSRETLFASGAGFALQWFRRPGDFTTPPQPRKNLGQLMRETIDTPRPPRLAWDHVNGVRALRIRWGGSPDDAGSDTFWIDPARGDALLKHESVLALPGEPREVEGVEITALKQSSQGVWFPTAGVLEMRDYGTPGGRLRMTYRAREVVTNDPKWDHAVFAPKVPPGYLVSDTRADPPTSYFVMRDGTTQPTQPGQALPAVRAGQVEVPK